MAENPSEFDNWCARTRIIRPIRACSNGGQPVGAYRTCFQMKNPEVGQRVRIKGKPEIYLIFQVDHTLCTVDLIMNAGNFEIVQQVAFSAVTPLIDFFLKFRGEE